MCLDPDPIEVHPIPVPLDICRNLTAACHSTVRTSERLGDQPPVLEQCAV